MICIYIYTTVLHSFCKPSLYEVKLPLSHNCVGGRGTLFLCIALGSTAGVLKLYISIFSIYFEFLKFYFRNLFRKLRFMAKFQKNFTDQFYCFYTMEIFFRIKIILYIKKFKNHCSTGCDNSINPPLYYNTIVAQCNYTNYQRNISSETTRVE